MEPANDIDRRDTLNLGDKKFVTKILKSGGKVHDLLKAKSLHRETDLDWRTD